MKRLISVFETTGNFSQFFQDAGWDVWMLDLQNWISFDIKRLKTAGDAIELFGDVDGLIGFPPCTDFTVSGAQYWPVKDKDGRTLSSIQLVNQYLKLVDLFYPTDPDFDGTFFWGMENPVGRIPKLFPELGKPAFYFHPWEYAGWNELDLNTLSELDRIRQKLGNGITAGEAELIYTSEAFTKKTCLWGNFAIPEKRPIEPVRGAPQGSVLQRAGGSSDKTKNFRSSSPLGFCKAFYEANHNYRPFDWASEYAIN